MLFPSDKTRIGELEQRLAHEAHRISDLETQLSSARQEAQAAIDEMRKCCDETAEMRALLANFQAFAYSLSNVQSSLKTMAEEAERGKGLAARGQKN